MSQTVIHSLSKELKLHKTTIVKLNMAKMSQLLATTPVTQTTGSTAPQCDLTTTSVTGIV